MSGESTGRKRLTVVPAPSPPRRIGPYELIRPAEPLGLPGLWFAQREAPSFLAGPSLLMPIDEEARRVPGMEGRVVRAARRAQGSRHPVLVRVEEVIATASELAVALEPVDGVALSHLLASTPALQTAFEPDVLLELGAQLLEALHDIHSLPRRDDAPGAHEHVCADTVLFCADGQVRLIGFGLVLASRHEPVEDTWNGRPATRSEAQALDLPALGDQFAVGLLLLQLATGRDLAQGVPENAIARAAAVDRLLSVLRLRGPMTPALLRLLTPNPAHRFADAGEAAAALRHPQGPRAAEGLAALIRRALAEPAIDGDPSREAPSLEQDTGALSVDDLVEVTDPWTVEDEPGPAPPRPARTRPSAPTFVPWTGPPKPPPGLSPGALGLLSAGMPSVRPPPQPMPSSAEEDRVTESQAARSPELARVASERGPAPRPPRHGPVEPRASAQQPPPDGTRKPGASTPLPPPEDDAEPEESWTTEPGQLAPQAPRAGEPEASLGAAAPPRTRFLEPALEAPTSVPGDAAPGPGWLAPPAALAVEQPSIDAPERPRRRRRQRRGGMRRVIRRQTVWSRGPVVRGVILGLVILLGVALAAGLWRRLGGTRPTTPPPVSAPAR